MATCRARWANLRDLFQHLGPQWWKGVEGVKGRHGHTVYSLTRRLTYLLPGVPLHTHICTCAQRAQAGRHTPHIPPQHLDVKTVVFIRTAAAPTFMPGALLKPHLACEAYCRYSVGGNSGMEGYRRCNAASLHQGGAGSGLRLRWHVSECVVTGQSYR